MARGVIHVNFAKSCFSLLKRAIIGTHHPMRRQHLPRYLREQEFRWNMRRDTDGEQAVAAIQGACGKRLMYRAPDSRELQTEDFPSFPCGRGWCASDSDYRFLMPDTFRIC